MSAVFTQPRLTVACLVVGAVACGARTGLLVPESQDAEGPPPPPVAVTPTTTPVSGCDAGATLIYVVTQQGQMLSFNPPTNAFTLIRQLACPVTIGADATPFSMAVDRSGTAYVEFQTQNPKQGELFRVSTATGACSATGFVNPASFTQFTNTYGMGYSTDVVDGGEVLYLASNEDVGSRLAMLDTRAFALSLVGPFDPPVVKPELTGTGAGDLFAFYSTEGGAAIAQIDKSTVGSTAQSMLPGVMPTFSWAFAIWGGDFYTFTSLTPNSATVVTRFRPSDSSLVQVAQFHDQIVGAGVSTCAPQR